MKNLTGNLLILCTILVSSTLSSQIKVEERFNPGPDRTNGFITIVTNGTAEPFRVELYKDGTKVATTPSGFINGAYTFNDLGIGSYVLKVFDRNDCETELGPFDLVEEHNCNLDVVVTFFQHSTGRFDGSCESNDPYADETFEDGVIEINVNTPDAYRIEWNGPNDFISNQERIEELAAGSYFRSLSSFESF